MKRLCGELMVNKNIPIENKFEQLEDIYKHKQLVENVCYVLVKYFFEINEDEKALDLFKRSFTHDLSKIKEDEFYGMAEFANDTGALKDPKKSADSDKQLAINLHWDRNSHHPEYWTNVNQMAEIDIIEMVCDWYARSIQFGNDMLDFFKVRQDERFHFPQDICDTIEKYYYIIKERI